MKAEIYMGVLFDAIKEAEAKYMPLQKIKYELQYQNIEGGHEIRIIAVQKEKQTELYKTSMVGENAKEILWTNTVNQFMFSGLHHILVKK